MYSAWSLCARLRFAVLGYFVVLSMERVSWFVCLAEWGLERCSGSGGEGE